MSDGKFAVLRQHNRCVHRSRQLGRAAVTSTVLHGKENSVLHLIGFFTVAHASPVQAVLRLNPRRV
jgi:hypothetical protein